MVDILIPKDQWEIVLNSHVRRLAKMVDEDAEAEIQFATDFPAKLLRSCFELSAPDPVTLYHGLQLILKADEFDNDFQGFLQILNAGLLNSKVNSQIYRHSGRKFEEIENINRIFNDLKREQLFSSLHPIAAVAREKSGLPSIFDFEYLPGVGEEILTCIRGMPNLPRSQGSQITGVTSEIIDQFLDNIKSGKSFRDADQQLRNRYKQLWQKLHFPNLTEYENLPLFSATRLREIAATVVSKKRSLYQEMVSEVLNPLPIPSTNREEKLLR